jgi:hypothetical protein
MAEKKTKKVVVKKTVTKKVAPKTISKKKIEGFLYEDVLKACGKNELEADKIMQLITDYSFEKDMKERQRCIAIAFGNWRHGAEFDVSQSTKETIEEHNFKKAQKILKKLMG